MARSMACGQSRSKDFQLLMLGPGRSVLAHIGSELHLAANETSRSADNVLSALLIALCDIGSDVSNVICTSRCITGLQ